MPWRRASEGEEKCDVLYAIEEVKNEWAVCPYCRASLSGKERDIGLTASPLAEGALSSFYENSWAVIIGINEYQDIDPLEYAVPNATALETMLPSLGFDPKILDLSLFS